jgi:hypothetical protein
MESGKGEHTVGGHPVSSVGRQCIIRHNSQVIAKSRAMEGAGTDWQGLSNHLQVPLPYLLYRAQVGVFQTRITDS